MVIICTYLSCFNEGNQIKSLCIYVPVLIQVSMMNTVTILAFHLNVYVVRSKELGPDRLFCIGPFYCCGISSFSQFKFVASERAEDTCWLNWYTYILPQFTFSSTEASISMSSNGAHTQLLWLVVYSGTWFVDRRLQVLNLYQGWVWVMGLLSGWECILYDSYTML